MNQRREEAHHVLQGNNIGKLYRGHVDTQEWKKLHEMNGDSSEFTYSLRPQAHTDVATSNIFEVVKDCVLSRGLRDAMDPSRSRRPGHIHRLHPLLAVLCRLQDVGRSVCDRSVLFSARMGGEKYSQFAD